MTYLDPAPTLREIAERLSLVQRWNGRTTIPWSVLQHSILTATLLPEDANPYLRLVTLLHDAGEAYTGDIMRGFKVPEQAAFEKDLLAEIYESMDLVAPGMSYSGALRFVDEVSALVEARCLVHPADRDRVQISHFEVYPDTDMDLVERGDRTLWNMRDMSRRDAINVWMEAVEKLIAALITPEEVEIYD